MISTNYAMNNTNILSYSRNLAFKSNADDSLYQQMAEITRETEEKQTQKEQKSQKRSHFIKNYKVPVVIALAGISAAGGYYIRPLTIYGEKNKIEILNNEIDSKRGELDSLNKAAAAKYCEIDSLSKVVTELDAANKTNFQDDKRASGTLNTDPYSFLSRDVAEKMLRDVCENAGVRIRRTNKWCEEFPIDGRKMAMGEDVYIGDVHIRRGFDGIYECRYGAAYLYDKQGNRLSSMDIRNLYKANLMHSLQNTDSLKFVNPDLFAAVLTSLEVFDVEHDEVEKRLCCKKKDGSALRISYDVKDGMMSGTIATFETFNQAKYSEQAPQSSKKFEYTISNNYNEPSAVFTTIETKKGKEKRCEDIFIISNDITYKNNETFIN